MKVDWLKTKDPAEIDGYNGLSPREKNAVALVLRGLHGWMNTQQEPSPMKVEVTKTNPFDMKSFAQVLHSAGVTITQEFSQKGNVATFQPLPLEYKLPRKRKQFNNQAGDLSDFFKTLYGDTSGSLNDLFKK
jgi:hypothetical protein